MTRLASDILVSAIVRAAQQLGGAAYIDRRGSQVSGAIFITVYNSDDRTYDLYEPLSQALVPDGIDASSTRYFTQLAQGTDRAFIHERFEKEARFDPDFWVVDLEGVSVDQLSDIIKLL